MPLILPGNVASATAATTYSVANSCLFNDDDSAKLTLTPGSTSDAIRQKWTFSCWFKIGNLGAQAGNRTIIFPRSDGSNYAWFYLNSSDQLLYNEYRSSTDINLITNRVFRDTAAWYHLVVATDTTQGTAANRVKIYINGVQETSFATETYPAQDFVTMYNSDALHTIGNDDGSSLFDGYLAEMVMVTNSQLAPTSFGEFDEDSPTIWKPIDVSGLTFGTNGFYLDFEASDNLGNDASGGTDWTETNIAATDQMTDTPTLNYCVWNPLTKFLAPSTFSQGNLRVVNPSTDSYFMNTGTFGLSKGLWYWEVKNISSVGNLDGIGITDRESRHYQNDFPGGTARSWCLYSNGDLYNNNVNSADFADTWTTNDIMGIYLDLNANKLYFAKNGTLQNSGTGISITAATGTEYGVYFPMTGDYSTNPWTGDFNFGGGCNFAISSAVADDDGSGAFEYDPTAGTFDSASKKFYAINSKNLAEYG